MMHSRRLRKALPVRGLLNVLPLLLIAGAFWAVILRPARARSAAVAKTQSELLPGSRIITTSGLYATVVEIDADDSMLLETSPGVVSRWARGALGTIVHGGGVVDPAPESPDPFRKQDPEDPPGLGGVRPV